MKRFRENKREIWYCIIIKFSSKGKIDNNNNNIYKCGNSYGMYDMT